jgi:hypothetical protein
MLDAAKRLFQAYRLELAVFAVSFVVLASFCGPRFFRQSAAPQFVYQAHAWLDGRLDLDPEVLPNIEDWACVKAGNGGTPVRCEVLPGAPGNKPDLRHSPPAAHWYSSFPWFPALVMVPFVAVNGYQFNDTSFNVFVAALAVALFFSLLRLLSQESKRADWENLTIAGILCVGSLFFYCSIRGEVWFSALTMGVALTCLYARFAIGARRPFWAGLFFSMAVLTRPPLLFAGLFFLLEAVCPGPSRLEQIRKLASEWKPAAKKVALFALGAMPLAVLAGAYNKYRFGSFGEFGHKFLYFNRVNVDIDKYGLFDVHYLARNLDSAFLKFPDFHMNPWRLAYDPNGMSLLVTLPIIVFLLVPKIRPRLHWPLWLTVVAVALPGLFYQNNGYMQFGFRFSVDYTPYLLLIFAIGGWSLKNRWVMAAIALSVLVNLWGALAFHGYSEMVHRW